MFNWIKSLFSAEKEVKSSLEKRIEETKASIVKVEEKLIKEAEAIPAIISAHGGHAVEEVKKVEPLVVQATKAEETVVAEAKVEVAAVEKTVKKVKAKTTVVDQKVAKTVKANAKKLEAAVSKSAKKPKNAK